MYSSGDKYNEFRLRRKTPEFKVLVVGFLLLVLTSCFFFFQVPHTIVLICLGFTFATYPASELIELYRKEERFQANLHYLLYLLYTLFILFCVLIFLSPGRMIMIAGACFIISPIKGVFRKFFLVKDKEQL